MARRFKVDAVFRGIDKITAPVRRMQQSVKMFRHQMSADFRAMRRASSKLGANLRNTGNQLKKVAAVATVGFGATIKTGADFEQAITNVGAVALKTRKEIEPLEKQALRLGKTTKFTATEVAQGMEVMMRAGFGVKGTGEAIEGVLSAAAASGLEMAEVAGHVSNVLKGMGLEFNQATRVSDVLTLAASKTNSTIGSLGESMANVAGNARRFRIPLEDVVASVALLQDVGLDASVAGTAMNRMLTAIAAPSGAAAKALKAVGIEAGDAENNLKSLPKVLEQILGGLNEVQGDLNEVGVLTQIFGLRGQRAADFLSELQKKGRLPDLVDDLEKAKGSAEKMAKLRMDTLYGDMLLLQSAISGIAIEAFKLEGGPLRNIIKGGKEWIKKNEVDLIAQLARSLEWLGETMSFLWENRDAVWETLKAITKITLAVKALSLAGDSLNLVLATGGLIARLGKIGLLLMAIAAATVLIIKYWDELEETFKRVGQAFSPGGIAMNPTMLAGLPPGTFIPMQPQTQGEGPVATTVPVNGAANEGINGSAKIVVESKSGTYAEIAELSKDLREILSMDASGGFNVLDR